MGLNDTIRIAMWSGPRNISTAMMRAWSSRADCKVLDEPFYAAYLATTGLDHPMREEILASQSQEWDEVAALCEKQGTAPITFQKHMSQHMVPEAPLEWMDACRHAFLIRPPIEVAASFQAKWEDLRADDLGFPAAGGTVRPCAKPCRHCTTGHFSRGRARRSGGHAEGALHSAVSALGPVNAVVGGWTTS